MLFRKIIGVLFLIIAGAFLGGAALFTAFEGPVSQAPPQGADIFRGAGTPPGKAAFLAAGAVTLAVGAVFSLIGVALFGFRKWKSSLGWTLAASGAYGLCSVLMMDSFYSSPVFLEQMEGRNPGSTKAIAQLSIATVPGFLSGGLLLLAGAALLWLTYSRKGKSGIATAGPDKISRPPVLGEPVDSVEVSAGNRPTSVTVISWCILVSCVLALAQGIWTMFDPLSQEAMKTVRAPIEVQYTMMFAGFIVSALCGIMMLRGRRWARSLWVAWTGVGMVVGLVISPMPLMIIPGLILFLVAASFLYRPVVSAYFSPPGEKASVYDS
ncbi:MAG: hypothetical protein VX387_04160 [Planctomycetota bacterium]|nr:hypothetical protein [Planctomycetota bacterium]